MNYYPSLHDRAATSWWEDERDYRSGYDSWRARLEMLASIVLLLLALSLGLQFIVPGPQANSGGVRTHAPALDMVACPTCSAGAPTRAPVSAAATIGTATSS